MHVDSKDIWSRKNVFAVSLMFYNANVKIISLRGKRDFRLTWQSRGSALANKVAFQRIATAPNVHVYLAVVSIEAIGNSVPRNDK